MSGVKNEKMPLKVAIINKSDSTGGAAVVSRRLMEALRNEGVDARMIVVEKLTNSPYIELAASEMAIKRNFIAERLKIFLHNGFNRKTLFKIDTASDGLPLWKNPLVKEADAVMLNWINQGMLSLKGVKKILDMGKPVIWTMHDMWCMTGICHHAGTCERFFEECGDCPLLGQLRGDNDLSHKIWLKKIKLNKGKNKIKYVAVSNWLADKAMDSLLLCNQNVSVIHNTFPLSGVGLRPKRNDDKIRILFGAARLDDPIKGLPVLIEMTRILRSNYPEIARRMEIATFGSVKNLASLKGFDLPHSHLGVIKGEENIRQTYEHSDILVSASSYETLPGTLVEAHAYGCIPISFNQGGQSDIINHLHTGYIANFSNDIHIAAQNLSKGVIWAASILQDKSSHNEMLYKMRENVITNFSPHAVAEAYINLIERK